MIIIKMVLLLTGFTIFSFTSVSAVPVGEMGPGSGKGQNLFVILQTIPEQPVDEKEIAGLKMMYEEEKLARDVYTELSRLWGLQIFSNISRSEQQHMNSVEMLLKRYNIEYESQNRSGTFHSSEMAALYEKLTAMGAKSSVDALRVGATVEDLDINDLYELTGQTDNKDIIMVYRNLAKGSRNHLRSFTSQLKNVGVEYKGQYLSDDQVKEIVNAPHERGPM